jgi:ferritin-like protein
MSDYHEPYDLLPARVREFHRALISLKEEIEAVDWYTQRIAVCSDPELAAVLAHSRDEEIEHSCMTLEWLRKNMPGWDAQIRQRLFTDGDQPAAAASAPEVSGTGLGVGKRQAGA